MAKGKKNKGKNQDGATATGDANGAPAEAKKPSKLGAILVPLVAFAAAGGASFALTQSPAAPVHTEPMSAKPSEPAAWAPPKPEKTVAIEPVLVSLGEANRVLKLGLALELADGDIDPDTPRLRDAFTGYIRTIGPEAISDPNFHSQLKRQLLHRARVVLGPESVTDILITDFMITR